MTATTDTLAPSFTPRQPLAASVRLTQYRGGVMPAWKTPDGRFLVTRNPGSRDCPFADSGWNVKDTKRTVWVGRKGDENASNVIRVFELSDARHMIAKALREDTKR